MKMAGDVLGAVLEFSGEGGLGTYDDANTPVNTNIYSE